MGAAPLLEYADSGKEEAIAAIIAALQKGKEDPRHFYIATEIGWTFHLWHRSAFLSRNWRMRGDPDGKCRDVVYDPTSQRIAKTAYWR